MKATLVPGIEFEMQYAVPPTKTVPALYPESSEFQEMPEVFATGYLIGLLEWTCVKAVNPHLEWPQEQTVGTHVNVSHTAATPPGMLVTVKVRLVDIQGRKLVFDVEAHDGVDSITKGTHERYVIDRDKFGSRVRDKAAGRPR